MFALLFIAALATPPNVEANSTGDTVQVLQLEGRTPVPLCTTPCSVSLPPDIKHQLLFRSDGHPTAKKQMRLQPGERLDLTVKPGKNGVFRTGNVMSGIGLIGMAVGSTLIAVDSPQGLSVVLSSASLALVAAPFQIAGATKVKKRSRR